MLTGNGVGSHASSRVTSERDFSKSSMRYDSTRAIPAPATAAATAASPKLTARREGTWIVCVVLSVTNPQLDEPEELSCTIQSCFAKSAGVFGAPRLSR